MEQATITLGGQEFQIRELGTKKADAWYRLFDELMLQPVLGVAAQWPTQNTLENPALLLGLLEQIKTKALAMIPACRELVFAYCPEIGREWVEENAGNSEIIDALTAVLRLAFPFGRIVSLVQSLLALDSQTKGQSESTGPLASLTTLSSRLPSGAPGPKTSIP